MAHEPNSVALFSLPPVLVCSLLPRWRSSDLPQNLKAAERELKETRAKLKAAETETLQWRKQGEEAEAKLRIRVGEGEARMVGAVEIATVHAEVEEARDETEEWKGRAEEAEAQLELGECERGREREEFEGKVAVIYTGGVSDDGRAG